MNSLQMLFIGFAVGLTGAVAPGPMLFATIQGALREGWTAGPKVVLGHALLEVLTCALLILGITAFATRNTITAVSIAGGGALCIFGWITIKHRDRAGIEMREATVIRSPMLAGIITSASNPYFWLWWLSAGNSLITEGLKISLIAALLFITGHWMADGAWYSLVSSSISRGRKIMSPAVHRKILFACGSFLILFGAAFILQHLPHSPLQ
jgi:threonine/homoserine/homoserine lactone efflux protein